LPRTPTQSDWNRFARAARRRARRLVEQYAAEKITAEEFGERFRDLLADRHGRAGYLGRRRGGADWDMDDDDREFGEVIADDEQVFLDQFVLDLALGRYRTAKGEPDVEAMDRRAQLYVRKLRGTSNEAFVGTADSADEIEWHLSAAEHCADCRSYGAGSPYKPDALPAYPGDGKSACITNCKCRLRRVSDKREGFRAE
jgi:hypothetical protein